MLEVTAAIIRKDNKILICQRPANKNCGLLWEFPGGKIEPGECPQEALAREIKEELAADIEVGELLKTVEWDYPAFHLTMHCFISKLITEDVKLMEHESSAWLSEDRLHTVQWLPADIEVLDEIIGYLK